MLLLIALILLLLLRALGLLLLIPLILLLGLLLLRLLLLITLRLLLALLILLLLVALCLLLLVALILLLSRALRLLLVLWLLWCWRFCRRRRPCGWRSLLFLGRLHRFGLVLFVVLWFLTSIGKCNIAHTKEQYCCTDASQSFHWSSLDFCVRPNQFRLVKECLVRSLLGRVVERLNVRQSLSEGLA